MDTTRTNNYNMTSSYQQSMSGMASSSSSSCIIDDVVNVDVRVIGRKFGGGGTPVDEYDQDGRRRRIRNGRGNTTTKTTTKTTTNIIPRAMMVVALMSYSPFSRGFSPLCRIQRSSSSSLLPSPSRAGMVYAPPGSGYHRSPPPEEVSVDDDDEQASLDLPSSSHPQLTMRDLSLISPRSLPATYEPMLEYPGTMRPGRTPENMPYHDLPNLDAHDPDPVPWPHFQEIEWHHRWDPPHEQALDMEEFIEVQGRWASVEDEAEMRMGMRRGVRERREMEEMNSGIGGGGGGGVAPTPTAGGGDGQMIIMDDDDEDDDGGYDGTVGGNLGLGDGVSALLRGTDPRGGRGSVDGAVSAVDDIDDDDVDDGSADDEGEEEEDDDFLLDLGLGGDDDGMLLLDGDMDDIDVEEASTSNQKLTKKGMIATGSAMAASSKKAIQMTVEEGMGDVDDDVIDLDE